MYVMHNKWTKLKIIEKAKREREKKERERERAREREKTRGGWRRREREWSNGNLKSIDSHIGMMTARRLLGRSRRGI